MVICAVKGEAVRTIELAVGPRGAHPCNVREVATAAIAADPELAPIRGNRIELLQSGEPPTGAEVRACPVDDHQRSGRRAARIAGGAVPARRLRDPRIVARRIVDRVEAEHDATGRGVAPVDTRPLSTRTHCGVDRERHGDTVWHWHPCWKRDIEWHDRFGVGERRVVDEGRRPTLVHRADRRQRVCEAQRATLTRGSMASGDGEAEPALDVHQRARRGGDHGRGCHGGRVVAPYIGGRRNRDVHAGQRHGACAAQRFRLVSNCDRDRRARGDRLRRSRRHARSVSTAAGALKGVCRRDRAGVRRGEESSIVRIQCSFERDIVGGDDDSRDARDHAVGARVRHRRVRRECCLELDSTTGDATAARERHVCRLGLTALERDRVCARAGADTHSGTRSDQCVFARRRVRVQPVQRERRRVRLRTEDSRE